MAKALPQSSLVAHPPLLAEAVEFKADVGDIGGKLLSLLGQGPVEDESRRSACCTVMMLAWMAGVIQLGNIDISPPR